MSPYRTAGATDTDRQPARDTRWARIGPWAFVLLAAAPNAIAALSGHGHDGRIDAAAMTLFALALCQIVVGARR